VRSLFSCGLFLNQLRVVFTLNTCIDLRSDQLARQIFAFPPDLQLGLIYSILRS
jgi:hypothetical protein